jgi:hypothetical protein
MISLYLLLMAGGVLLSVYLQTGGYTVPNAIRGVGLLWLNAAVLLTLSLWGGVRLSTIANGVLVFGMFGVSFIGGWIEQIGGFLPNPATQVTAMRIGVVTSLLLPTEALWKRAAYEMQSPLMATFGVSPFTSRSVPSGAMIVYAVLYAAVLLVLTMRHLRARDL